MWVPSNYVGPVPKVVGVTWISTDHGKCVENHVIESVLLSYFIYLRSSSTTDNKHKHSLSHLLEISRHVLQRGVTMEG